MGVISLEIDYPAAKKESQGKRQNPTKITVTGAAESAFMTKIGISKGQHKSCTMQGSKLLCTHVAKSVIISVVATV